jgi:hypothetical protein
MDDDLGVATTVVNCLIHKKKISWAKVFKQCIRAEVEKLTSVSASYLVAYAINLYAKEDLLTKAKKKKYDNIKWSLDKGDEWLINDPEEAENLDEENKQIGTDKEEEPTP